MGRRWAMVAVAWWVLTLSAETRPTASGAFAPPMLGLSGLERRQFPSMHALRNAAPRRSSSGGCIMSWRLPKGTRSEVDSRAMKVDPALLAKYGVRIASIASLVKTGSSVIDVGCDHGLLSIGLVASGTASRVIASDANELPLENARRNLGDTSSAISEKVEVRLGDGLKVLSHGEVDTACICGMGGPTISEILFGSSSGGHFYALSKESGNSGGEPSTGGLPSRLGIERLIMQPTAYPEQLRSALHAHGWRIDDEVLTCDGRWAHIVISATRDGDQQDLALEHSYEDVLLGPILKNETSEVWGLWVDHQLRHYELKLFGLQRSGQSGEELQHAEQCVEILQRTKARLRDLKA